MQFCVSMNYDVISMNYGVMNKKEVWCFEKELWCYVRMKYTSKQQSSGNVLTVSNTVASW